MLAKKYMFYLFPFFIVFHKLENIDPGLWTTWRYLQEIKTKAKKELKICQIFLFMAINIFSVHKRSKKLKFL